MGEGVNASVMARMGASRRHFLAIGGIATSALLARVSTARAKKHGDGDGGDDGDGGNCFLKGTVIATAEGGRKVEDLAIGDRLPTVFGGLRPIQWIGHYRYRRSDPKKAWVENVRPVRIAASAIAPNVPHADLFVTPSHRLLVDGALVTAGDLINGTTITRDAADDAAELVYFHIKLESHDVIYAEGAACETLLNVDEAAVNFGDYLRAHGMPEAPALPCAPLLSHDGAMSKMMSHLRSAASPWVDRRRKLDVIRDRLDERGIALKALTAPV
jgi:Hint domain